MIPQDADKKPDETWNGRAPDFSREADVLHVFDDFNTLGDDRYPPVRRPPVYPIVMAPEMPKSDV